MKMIRMLAFFLFVSPLLAQEETAVLKTLTGNLEGSLLFPSLTSGIPVVLIVAGSGPTDRNGNQEELQNNSLKMLAEELKTLGVASLRYDKRGVGQSISNLEEMEMRFETFSEDVRSWIDWLAADKRFTKIIVAGHSEGSLLSIIASVNNPHVKGLISLAGAGRSIDEVLKEQLANTPDQIKATMFGMLDKLKKGDTLGEVPPIFYAFFRPSIQPYMISWMKYNPQTELAKLKIPILVINGNKDVQVSTKDADLLAQSNKQAQLRIIKNMNHVLKTTDTLDKKLQMPVYDNPTLPLNTDFCKVLRDFMLPFLPAQAPKVKD